MAVEDVGRADIIVVDGAEVTKSRNVVTIKLQAAIDDHADDEDAHHDPVTLGDGSDAALTLDGQELTLADVLTPDEHTAIGDGAPHHARLHGLGSTDDHDNLGDYSVALGLYSLAVADAAFALFIDYGSPNVMFDVDGEDRDCLWYDRENDVYNFTIHGAVDAQVSATAVTAALFDGAATGLQETTGPTALAMGAVADGEYLKRDGATIISGAGGGGAAAMDDLTDADTTTDAPVKNEVLKWNGTNWVPAVYDASFTFSIASFTDNITPNLLIGSGVWKADEAITFGATYNNGPPTTIVVEMTVNGAAYAKVGEMTGPAYTAGINTEGDINYPSKGQYLRFRLDGDDGTDHDTEYDTAIYFYNYLYFGVIAKADTFTEGDIEGLTTHKDLCTSGNLSHSVTAAAGEYIVLAYPTDYTAMTPGVDYDATGASSFLLNGVTVGMARDNAALEITNSAGYVENYDVYVSTVAALGGPFTFVAGTTPNTCNYVYWGELDKAGTYTEADVEDNAASQPGKVATNSISARSMTVNAAVDEYTYIAYPTRLGTMTSCVIGGLESKGDFNVDSTTLAITNENGWTEHYTVYVSDNPGFTDPTTMTVTVA
jgi:hypothetical protein